MPGTVSVNIYDPAVLADPWPALEEIRDAGPVVFNEALGVWHVTRYHDVAACFSDPLRFSSTVHQRVTPGVPDNMITTDPPTHDRLRQPFQSAFTKRELGAYESRVTVVIDELFAEFVAASAGADCVDVVAGFIDHIPAFIIAELLGVPTERRTDFHEWSNDIVNGVGSALDDSEAGQQRRLLGREASMRVQRYLSEVIDARAGRVSDDLIGQAIAASLDGSLRADELADAAHLFLVAGNDTTSKELAWCVVRLAQFPEQRRLLLDDPALIPSAIEEALRYEALSLSIPRLVVGGPVEVGGETLPDDAVVWLMTGLANRDPDVFERPDEFDVLRPRTNNHFGFGHGTHLCLGANLARMEIRLGLERILAEFPDYGVRGYELNKGWSARGPVRVDFEPVAEGAA